MSIASKRKFHDDAIPINRERALNYLWFAQAIYHVEFASRRLHYYSEHYYARITRADR